MVEKSVIKVSSNSTRVAKVTIGRPVRRVYEQGGRLERLNDVDLSSLSDGAVLVYSSSTSKWTATLDLEEQNINGGSY